MRIVFGRGDQRAEWKRASLQLSWTAIVVCKGSLIKLLFCCRYCRIRCATTTRENGRSSSTGPWSSTSTAMWVPSFSTSLSLFPFSPSLLARHAFFTIPFGREVATRLLIEMSKRRVSRPSLVISPEKVDQNRDQFFSFWYRPFSLNEDIGENWCSPLLIFLEGRGKKVKRAN